MSRPPGSDATSTVDGVFDVVVVGSLNLDLVATTERLPSPGETVHGHEYREFAGGKGLNQAIAAARAGALVAMVGAVGDDAAGARLRQIVGEAGVDDSDLVTIDGSATGRALITVDSHAENAIVVVPGANGLLTAAHVRIPPARVLLAEAEIPQDVIRYAFEGARSHATTTILNPAPAADITDEVIAASDIVIPNEHELGLLGGEAELRRRGVETLIVTMGAAGAEHRRDGTDHHQPAFAVEAVDTTGAGDAFCGAFAAQTAAGADIASAMRFAAAAGALAASRSGAVPSLPHRAEIERLLDRQR